MGQIFFRISPDHIPLGKAVDAMLVIHLAGEERTVEKVVGRLKCAPGIKVIGKSGIDIPRLSIGQQVEIPIRIWGDTYGKTCIIISRLNAQTAGGRFIEFNDFPLDIDISDPEIAPTDIGFTFECPDPVIQYAMSTLTGRLRNNSSFPLSILSLDIVADGGELYNKPESLAGRLIQPGESLLFETRFLPKHAGMLPISLEVWFRVQEQSLSHRAKQILKVIPSDRPDPPKLPAKVKTLLLINSAPVNGAPIRTDREIKNILLEIKQSAKLRDEFQVEVLPAATGEELTREIIVWHPYLVHFAGHGTPEGIIVENESGKGRLFSAQALAALFKPLAGQIECVILNACYSKHTAEKIAEHIPFVIGMQNSIIDGTALAFSKGFYQAIGAGHSIKTAFELGRAILNDGHVAESDIPFLLMRS